MTCNLLHCRGVVLTMHLQGYGADLQAMLQSLRTEQLQRQWRAKKRAEHAHASSQRRIKELGKESALTYGQKLYSICVDKVAQSLDKSFSEYLLEPDKARKHGAAIPYFNPFSGAHHIAAIALVATLDQLSRRQRLPTFCQNLGAAIEKECRLMRLEGKSPLELRRLMRQGLTRSKISSREIMRQLGCPVPGFNDLARLQIGQFLLDHVAESGLVHVIRLKIGRTTPRFVVPTDEAEIFIKNCPQGLYKTAHSAMICAPESWPGLYGGGILGNEECLIRVPIQDSEEKDTSAIEHYRKADLSKFLIAVNHLQGVPLRVDREMVALERVSWENGIGGLWPCSRAPLQVPERLSNEADSDEILARNRLAAQAHRDREQNRHRRVKIERGLQAAEELSGRTVWQSHHADHRGRVYTGNKYVTSQGPDHEKALLSFDEELPVNDQAMEWLFKAAAGHYGLSRQSWDERLKWGVQNREAMIAAASDPLEKRELWRSAKDPWQYLQICKGVKEASERGRTGVPIRFDQTTSGCGILAALLRNKPVGRLCNLYGDTPQDLYTLVAEGVIERLAQDLQLGETKERALAELWLKRGIDRSLCKGPILAAPYGGSYMSLCDSLVDALDQHLGYVPLNEYAYRVAVPAKYLASHLWAEMKEIIAPCLELKQWLKKVTRKVMSKGHTLSWTTPSNWPMHIADREPQVRLIRTLLFGQKISIKYVDQPVESPLCATQANKGIAANFTHAMDAAFLHNFTYRAAELSIPVLTNHDCFACHAINAGEVHRLLHDEFRQLYTPNWLARFKEEIENRTGISLPKMPGQGRLSPADIGSNLYLFS